MYSETCRRKKNLFYLGGKYVYLLYSDNQNNVIYKVVFANLSVNCRFIFHNSQNNFKLLLLYQIAIYIY